MLQETFISCMGACFIQSSALFWIKPIIKTQHARGGTMRETFHALKNSSDPLRFYRGFVPSLFKSSISRTSDITIFRWYEKNISKENTESSLASGILSSVVKILFFPLDTLSNIYQVHGREGHKYIQGNLYRGTLAYGAINTVSSSVWLLSYSNLKNRNFFQNQNMNFITTGVICSLITDIVVNPFRVIKTNRQVRAVPYAEILKKLIRDMGFYRGFLTRIGYNSLNGALFILSWQNLEMIIKKGQET